ncbi:IclR family transcriptional regulator [Palleronia caenipelagi]|uniref:IclR family transcriptional regulator n=1 Tax=Palleronia caenipelagi TaxID=2489174 RepID=A0A547Q8W1_9RHOB|nr:IclR family transcriptional regulator [Palleronia caenipelagi]TRD22812.1 IclR family transcriptional regulator [Palleronia caenipelagi]
MAAPDGTVGKAMDVLERVASYGGPVRFADLLSEGGYPKATLYRLLQVLVNQRLLTIDRATGKYELGVRLVRLAHQAWSQASLAPLARPHLEHLAQVTGQAVHLAQLDGGQVLYLDKLNPAQPVEMFSAIGRVGPAYCTGVGKAMLAFLPGEALESALSQQSFHRFTPATLDRAGLLAEHEAIRREGVAWDRQEHEPGITCLAAPVLSDAGRVLGAVSITSAGGGEALLAAHTGIVKDTAGAIARDAAAWRFPEQSKLNVAE